MQKNILVVVPEDVHKKLMALARDRRISLKQLTMAVLMWVGEQDGTSLVRLGVDIPVWASDKPEYKQQLD